MNAARRRHLLHVVTWACVSSGACASSTSSSSSSTLGTRAAANAGSAPAPRSNGVFRVTDTRPGFGLRATANSCLYVHYVGTFADGRRFESSRDTLSSGEVPSPVAFELGARSVMAGWEKGLNGMQVGSMRRLSVPYTMAYGLEGRPPLIPPRTDLVFDVELMAVAPTLPNSSKAERTPSAPTCPSWSSVRR